MFTTIVVGTDGSDNARKAVRAAAALAKEQGAKLHVVTAARPLTPQALHELKQVVPDEFWPQLHADYLIESKVSDAEAICKVQGVDPVSHVLSDPAAHAILDVAEANSADLIVVGSRGEGAAKRLIHGSVSTKVMHHADCSVLIIHDEADSKASK